jgi:hypothetical protein
MTGTMPLRVVATSATEAVVVGQYDAFGVLGLADQHAAIMSVDVAAPAASPSSSTAMFRSRHASLSSSGGALRSSPAIVLALRECVAYSRWSQDLK